MIKLLEERTKQGIVEHEGFSANVAETLLKGALLLCKPDFKRFSKSEREDLTLGRAFFGLKKFSCDDAIVNKVKEILILIKDTIAFDSQTKSGYMREQKCLKGCAESLIQSHLMIYGGMRTTE
jgi:hypothetical protein